MEPKMTSVSAELDGDLIRVQVTFEVEGEVLRKMFPIQVRSTCGLTRTQQRVLSRVREHKSNKEIANELYVSVRTIKYHVSDLLQKFDVNSRSKL